jgi:hypothetical protein
VDPCRVLHDNDVQICEILCFESENSVDPCQERFVFGHLYMENVVVKHAQKDFSLFVFQGLNQKFVVVGEKEKRATLASPLACFKHHPPVVEETQRLSHLLRRDVI